MDQPENHLTVERIAPVLGSLQLQIIQLEAAVQMRDEIIAQLKQELGSRNGRKAAVADGA